MTAKCGTRSGYDLHRRSEEEPCEACVVAKRKYNNKYRRRKAAARAAMAEATNRLISPGQELRVRELSKTLLGDQDRIDQIVGSAAGTWSGVEASRVISVLLELEDTQFGRSRVGNRVSWLRSRLKVAS